MKRTTKRRLEIGIVIGLILICFWASLPRFLHSQHTHALRRIMDDLEAIVCAVEVYRLDHGTFPPAFYPSEDDPFVSRLSSGLNLHVEPLFEKDYQKKIGFLIENGYLETFPDYIPNFRKKRKQNFDLDIVMLWDNNITPSLPKKENWALVFGWPFAEENDLLPFISKLAGSPSIGPVYLSHYDDPSAAFNKALIGGAGFFHPSNGLQSAGYIYCDIHDNRSPVK